MGGEVRIVGVVSRSWTQPEAGLQSLSQASMGVDIETLQPGDGTTFPKPGQKVTCHYVLTLQDGRKIDSSRDRGQPFQFNIGRQEVIAGWDEGVAKMSKGQRRRSSPSLRTWATGQTGCLARFPEARLSSSMLS